MNYNITKSNYKIQNCCLNLLEQQEKSNKYQKEGFISISCKEWKILEKNRSHQSSILSTETNAHSEANKTRTLQVMNNLEIIIDTEDDTSSNNIELQPTN